LDFLRHSALQALTSVEAAGSEMLLKIWKEFQGRKAKIPNYHDAFIF